MGKVVFGMAMSLDGFVNDREGDVGRLYPDFDAFRSGEVLRESIATTEAVVMGRRAYEMGDPDSYAGNYEYQAPIFVLTHHIPEKLPKEDKRLTFTFVTDGIHSAIEKAKAAAGDKNVTVIGGANTVQQLIRAGLLDEIQIHLVPVLLGDGLCLFEHLGAERIELERTHVIESPSVTHLRFRIVKRNDARK
jgi:dihydrofolate reductase